MDVKTVTTALQGSAQLPSLLSTSTTAQASTSSLCPTVSKVSGLTRSISVPSTSPSLSGLGVVAKKVSDKADPLESARKAYAELKELAIHQPLSFEAMLQKVRGLFDPRNAAVGQLVEDRVLPILCRAYPLLLPSESAALLKTLFVSEGAVLRSLSGETLLLLTEFFGNKISVDGDSLSGEDYEEYFEQLNQLSAETTSLFRKHEIARMIEVLQPLLEQTDKFSAKLVQQMAEWIGKTCMQHKRCTFSYSLMLFLHELHSRCRFLKEAEKAPLKRLICDLCTYLFAHPTLLSGESVVCLFKTLLIAQLHGVDSSPDYAVLAAEVVPSLRFEEEFEGEWQNNAEILAFFYRGETPWTTLTEAQIDQLLTLIEARIQAESILPEDVAAFFKDLGPLVGKKELSSRLLQVQSDYHKPSSKRQQ